jgi:hypothetical protein
MAVTLCCATSRSGRAYRRARPTATLGPQCGQWPHSTHRRGGELIGNFKNPGQSWEAAVASMIMTSAPTPSDLFLRGLTPKLDVDY